VYVVIYYVNIFFVKHCLSLKFLYVPVYCLCFVFFGIRILITPLVSSNSSYIEYIKLNIVFEMGYSDANSC
jgi:hypothetical protein